MFIYSSDTAPTKVYTLSLHDALPIFGAVGEAARAFGGLAEDLAVLSIEDGKRGRLFGKCRLRDRQDRKSTRLNSSHITISYAVFCLKKKITTTTCLTTKINVNSKCKT